MRSLGPVRDGGGASKPPTKTKAQIEADERARSAAAARQAAANAEAARQRKAEVERQERAQASQLAAAAALRKLQTSGANSLSNAERALLGMAPAGTPIAAKPTTSTVKPSPAPTPVAAAPAASTPPKSQPPVTVTPEPPAVVIPDPPRFEAVKAAPIDTVVFVDESFSNEFITDLLFEDVGGQELLSIARDDTVNGQEVVYQPFKNLGILRDTYNINNLLKLQETSDRFFANFTIKLLDKIPKVGNGPDGKNYYFDQETGEGIIEFINMRDDEQVEVQISNAGIIEEVGI
jgi:hypothetical protein